MGVAEEEGKIPAEEEGKIPADEEDKNRAVEEDKNRAAQPEMQPEIDPGAEKSCNDDKTQVPNYSEEPTSEGGSNGQIFLSKAEKTQVLVDVEKPQLKEKKEKKRKRRELVKIKKEHQLGGVEKTEIPVDTEEPASEGGSALINKEHVLLSKAEKKRWRVELVKIKQEHQMGGGEIAWRWHAFYSTMLHRQMMRLYEGSILQRAEVKRIFLLDTDETVVDGYYLKEGESVHPGSVFKFPCHKVDVGERILQPDVCTEDEAALALVERGIDNEKEKPPSKRDEKKRKRLKRKPQPVEGLICLQDWLKAADSKPTNKYVEEEEYLVFYQASKCQEEGRARSRTRRSSSPSPSPTSSGSPSPSS